MTYPAGTILVATTKSPWSSEDQSKYLTGIVAVVPKTGAQTLVSEGDLLKTPTYIAHEPGSNTIYVSDLNATVAFRLAARSRRFGPPGQRQGLSALEAAAPSQAGAIVGVNLDDGKQTAIASGGLIDGPNGLACINNGLYVVNEGDSSGKVHSLVRLDLRTRHQMLLSETASG